MDSKATKLLGQSLSSAKFCEEDYTAMLVLEPLNDSPHRLLYVGSMQEGSTCLYRKSRRVDVVVGGIG